MKESRRGGYQSCSYAKTNEDREREQVRVCAGERERHKPSV